MWRRPLRRLEQLSRTCSVVGGCITLGGGGGSVGHSHANGFAALTAPARKSPAIGAFAASCASLLSCSYLSAMAAMAWAFSASALRAAIYLHPPVALPSAAASFAFLPLDVVQPHRLDACCRQGDDCCQQGRAQPYFQATVAEFGKISRHPQIAVRVRRRRSLIATTRLRSSNSPAPESRNTGMSSTIPSVHAGHIAHAHHDPAPQRVAP